MEEGKNNEEETGRRGKRKSGQVWLQKQEGWGGRRRKQGKRAERKEDEGRKGRKEEGKKGRIGKRKAERSAAKTIMDGGSEEKEKVEKEKQ